MAGLKIRVMKTVSEGTKKIIMRRARMEGLDILFHENAALALCNGNVCDLIYASDLAQKAILGTAAAVDEAVKRIQSEL